MKDSLRLALVAMKHDYLNPDAPSHEHRGDIEANLARHRRWIERALEHDPEFIGFPEFSVTGWVEKPEYALTLDGPVIREIESWARRHKLFLATGFVERRGGRLYNTCLIAGPRGRVGLMHKVNPVPRELRCYTPGRGFPVFRVAGCRLAVATCADASYFETFRLLSLRGAEVIFAPHANSLGAYGNCRDGWARWRMENWPYFTKTCCVAVAGMSCAGQLERPRKDEHVLKYCSGGMVMDWTGRPLAQLKGAHKREGLLTARIDLAALRAARAKRGRDFHASALYNRRTPWAWGAY
jgi:predicted amidohydrolase